MRVLHFSTAYGYWGVLDPSCLDNESGKQVGGGETAMFNACFELAALGHDITCAFRCAPGSYKDVTFRHIKEAESLLLDEWDAVVSWDNVEPLLPLKGEGAKLFCSNQMNHISPLGRGEEEITFISPSRTHAKLMEAVYGIKRMAAIPNAVHKSWFSCEQRDPNRVMYASSPDRGLHHLLDAWPMVKKARPDAHLHVYYEIERWKGMIDHLGRYVDPQVADLARYVYERKLRPPEGVVFEGAKHPRVVAKDMCVSGVLAYPCDTMSFTEGFGTTVLQAYVAGMYPITTDTDAFGEIYGESSDAIPLTGAYGEVNPLIKRACIAEELPSRIILALDAMNGRNSWAFKDAIAQKALAEKYSWGMVGRLWNELLAGRRVFWPEVSA